MDKECSMCHNNGFITIEEYKMPLSKTILNKEQKIKCPLCQQSKELNNTLNLLISSAYMSCKE